MKHDLLEDDLKQYLGLMGLQFKDQQVGLLARHIRLVLEANRRVNLTRVIDSGAAVRLHAADSLSVLADLESAPSGAALDLGAGAGFPGVPLAIASGRHFTLLDSVGKKMRALEPIIDELGLSSLVTCQVGRAEAFARTNAAGYSVVTARAVSELPALVELASPLLSPRGRLICMKGGPSAEERERAEEVALIVGMRTEYVRELELPEDVGHRTILCYRKTGASRVRLPRREGLAQHSPLA